MIKQTVTYKDFNGADRREEVYFNLTEFELLEIQAESERGIEVDFKEAVANEDARGILKFVKLLVHNGYGVKSADGRHFEKSPEILQQFVQSALYSDLIMDMFTHPDKMFKFINELMPASLVERAAAMQVEVAKLEETEAAPNPYANGFEGVVHEAPPLKAEIADQDHLEFEAWKAARAAEVEQSMTRPPHESGQGYQL